MIAENKMTATYVLVDDDAVGDDTIKVLCERRLARARRAPSLVVHRLNTQSRTQNAPNANQDDLCHCRTGKSRARLRKRLFLIRSPRSAQCM